MLGERKFMKLITAYLAKYPSASFTLRNLGSRLEQFLRDEPRWIAPRAELALDMVRFEWAQVVAFDDEAKPAITPDDILDARPDKLRLGLQPYLSLLELNYEVDEFLLAVKKGDSAVLRSEASNTFEAMPHASGPEKRIRLPKRKRIHLAVHRHDNMLYYKRLDPEGFVILTGVARGRERRGSLFARPLVHEADRRRLDRGNQGLLQQLGVARLVLPVLEKMKTDSGFIAKYFSLVCSSDQLLAIALSSRHPALLGLGVFSHRQRQVDGLGKADAIFPKPRNSFSRICKRFWWARPNASAVCFLLVGSCSRLISIPLTILS